MKGRVGIERSEARDDEVGRKNGSRESSEEKTTRNGVFQKLKIIFRYYENNLTASEKALKRVGENGSNLAVKSPEFI